MSDEKPWRPWHDRSFMVVVGLVVVCWVAYGIALATRPDDALAAYRNDAFWPAASYLTVAQAGIALPLFGHVLVTFIGGTFVAMLVMGLVGLARRAGGPDLRAAAALVVYVLVAIYAFALLRAVPARVTVVDDEQRVLHVRTFAAMTFLPSDVQIVKGSELRAFIARVGTYGSRRGSETVVRIYASRTVGEVILLGLRPCPDAASCLAAADDGVAAVSRAMGRTITTPTTGDDGKSRAYMLAP